MAMTNLEGAEESCLKDVSRITAMHKYHPTATQGASRYMSGSHDGGAQTWH